MDRCFGMGAAHVGRAALIAWLALASACSSQSPAQMNCGNGMLEPGETCDPPGSCPSSCSDGNACTRDGTAGSAASCDLACTHDAIAACAGGDGCCPAGCTPSTDADCSATCGNGRREPGETCDPPGVCPTSCSDGNACTRDGTTGSAATCNVACTYEAISACAGGDACCPAGCNVNNDADCSATCGNSVIEPGETCDPPGTCPASCSDGNACTLDTATGSAANCNLACTHAAIVSCESGDGCCPAGCNANNDADCSTTCGNGVIEPGETCDPPGTCPTTCNDGNACTVDTTTGSAENCNVACVRTAVVTCSSGDGCCPAGCDANSDAECSATCGNSVIEPGETCDPPSSCPATCNDDNACTIDTATGSAANCNLACAHSAIVTCGSSDACCPAGCNANNDLDCSVTCGNGVIEPGETCDPPSSCPATCSDGNSCTTDTSTGSAANCNLRCTHDGIISCGDGDGCCPMFCTAANDSDCAAICGNGVTEPGEVCDGPECPTTCNDGNACTVDSGTGSAAQCNLSCSYSLVTACQSGDGCCPQQCTAANDSDCSGSWQSDVAVSVSQQFGKPVAECSNALALGNSGDAFITFWVDASIGGSFIEQELRIARRTGGTWSAEVVRSRTRHPFPGKHSLVVDPAGTPHACHFEDVFGLDVFHDVRTATGWVAEDAGIRAVPYSSGIQACSIALDPAGLPRIAYVASATFNAPPFITSAIRNAAGSWGFEFIVFSDAGRQRRPGWPAFAIDSTARPHLGFGITSMRTLPTRDYAYKDASNQWVYLDAPNAYSTAPTAQAAIALDGNNNANLAYFTPSDRAITFARRAGTTWQLQMIDPGPADGEVAIALDASGRGHVVYRRGANTIMYARQTATSWNLQPVATNAAMAPGSGCIGIAIDGAGVPHVSYVVDGSSRRDVRFATRVP